MQPQHCCRIDLGELQALISKKLGPNKSKQYFYYLNRFLNQKLSKNEFNKLCIRVLGRENIELHNQFIQSILKNVCQAKTAPPISISANTSVREEGFERRDDVLPNHNQTVHACSNGFGPPPSRKSRLMNHDQKLKDNEKVNYASQRITGGENSRKVGVGNRTIIPCDYQRPLHNLQSAEQRRINNEIEAHLVEDGEEPSKLNSSQRPLIAPLGIPQWSAGLGGPCKSMPTVNSIDFPSYFYSGGLYDAETLRKRMEQIAISEGLGGVSPECGNLLNNIMDVYLKRLVKSCVELVGARSTSQSRRNHMHKPINGTWPNDHLHAQNGSEPIDVLHEQKPQYSISMLDFKVAMELNPKQLGGDWPLRLEKICMHPFDQ